MIATPEFRSLETDIERKQEPSARTSMYVAAVPGNAAQVMSNDNFVFYNVPDRALVFASSINVRLICESNIRVVFMLFYIFIPATAFIYCTWENECKRTQSSCAFGLLNVHTESTLTYVFSSVNVKLVYGGGHPRVFLSRQLSNTVNESDSIIITGSNTLLAASVEEKKKIYCTHLLFMTTINDPSLV